MILVLTARRVRQDVPISQVDSTPLTPSRHRPAVRVSGILYISPPAHYFDAVNGYYVGEIGEWCVFSHHEPLTDTLGPVPVVEAVGGCKTAVRCNVAPPVYLSSGEELRFKSDADPDDVVRVSGVLYISPPAHYFDAVNGYYVGKIGRRQNLPRHVPLADALGPVPVVEAVGGRKTTVRCNVAPPVRLASGQELRFEPNRYP